MTISKYARNEGFGDEIFAGMDEFLKAEFPEAENPLAKKAALEEPKVSAFGDLVGALVSTAEVLEQLEHPKAEQAYRILAFIEDEMLGLKKKVAQPEEEGDMAGALGEPHFQNESPDFSDEYQQVEEEASNANERVRAAFQANPDNVEKVLSTRNPGEGAMGSVFNEPQTAESLLAADWKAYDHPDVKAPATAFAANVPGSVGVVEVTKLDPNTEITLVDGHETGFLAPVAKGLGREVTSDQTVLLLGPIDDPGTEGVWTFFPGEPVMPSELKVEDVPMEDRQMPASEAAKLGFRYVKVEG